MTNRIENITLLRTLLEIACHRPQLKPLLALKAPYRPWGYADGYYQQQAANDVWRLKVLHDHDDGVHERINKRHRLLLAIQANQHEGKIKTVESGRDCDCVEYSGRERIIDANVMAFEKLDKDTAAWADGPFHIAIVPWELEVEYESRDLVMEAYEDGHPHSITSRFP
jgi:hypothetical protein